MNRLDKTLGYLGVKPEEVGVEYWADEAGATVLLAIVEKMKAFEARIAKLESPTPSIEETPNEKPYRVVFRPAHMGATGRARTCRYLRELLGVGLHRANALLAGSSVVVKCGDSFDEIAWLTQALAHFPESFQALFTIHEPLPGEEEA